MIWLTIYLSEQTNDLVIDPQIAYLKKKNLTYEMGSKEQKKLIQDRMSLNSHINQSLKIIFIKKKIN